MASETSSVLEMEDADMEALSTDDDPLMMQPGHDIAVKVDAPMKQLSTLETFVSYRVRCVCARWPPSPPVRRRYNHFKLLHKRLSSSHAWVPVPPPPPLHTARQQLDRYSPSFVAIRTRALNAFLDRIVKHPLFTHSEDLKIFLTTPDEEFEKVFKSENSALNLWGLSSALYGNNETKPPANGARVKDPEWVSHVEYLQSLEQKLTTLNTLTTKLYRGAAALAAERANLQRVCSSWSSQAGGQLGRACGAVGVGAGGAAPPLPPPIEQRARLPLLSAYTAAMTKSVLARQQAHAAYVADPNPTGELHNKLEQASEALRSELADWLPTTRAEVKALLLLTAEQQVSHYARIVSSWENARSRLEPLNASGAPLFETVSRAAAIHLSPSKYLNIHGSDSVSTPENSVSVPENSASIAENSVNIAENSVSVAETSANIAENSVNIAENSVSVAEISGNIADNSASANKNPENTTYNENNIKTHNSSAINIQDSVNNLSKNTSAINIVKNISSDSSSLENIRQSSKSSFSELLDAPLNEQVISRSDDDIIDNTNSASLEPSLELPSDPLREFTDVDLS